MAILCKGVVTEKCDPYFDNIGCSHPSCEPTYPTPQCNRKCVKENLLWSKSKHFGVNANYISSDPYSIMTEVYKNGPVGVAFSVYEDFAHYKSGVDNYVTGKYLGGHAAKLIGLGTSEEGENYWVAAEKPLSEAKDESAILQDSIIKYVNENAEAGWKAAFNPQLSSFTVSQFKRLLGVKHAREGDLEGHCGSCWAFGAVESLSDHFCFYYNLSISLSVQGSL